MYIVHTLYSSTVVAFIYTTGDIIGKLFIVQQILSKGMELHGYNSWLNTNDLNMHIYLIFESA